MILISFIYEMKKHDNLMTPEWVWKPLGKIDLDPCAGRQTMIGEVNYRFEDGQDGLKLPWLGFVFCNPPFSEKEAWTKKMIEHGNGILLLPERGSAPWCGPVKAACGTHFVMGKKINFIGGPSSNNLGSIMFLFGEEAIDRVLSSDLPGSMEKTLFFRSR